MSWDYLKLHKQHTTLNTFYELYKNLPITSVVLPMIFESILVTWHIVLSFLIHSFKSVKVHSKCAFIQLFLSFSDQVSSALFFQYNTQLGPPYYILVDTNFINFSIKNKLDLFQSMMDCLYAKCKLELLCFKISAMLCCSQLVNIQ